MKHLSPIDRLFLLAERRHQPLHVGALCLFEPPTGAPRDFSAQLAHHLRESTTATAPFNRRLEGRWGLKSWDEPNDFDLHQHFVHLSLPQPGRVRELLAMVSRVHSAHLDRAYPLWRSYLIEGLDDGRIALYTKIHHSVVDGVAGIRLMLKAMTNDPASSMDMPAPWEMKPAEMRRWKVKSGHNKAPQQSDSEITIAPMQRLHQLAQVARSGALATPTVARYLRQTVSHIRSGHPDAVSSIQAPRCILNSDITGSRRFAAQSYSTERIRRIARQFDGTLNDVVLALCGSALRQYLLDLNALPEKPLIAAVPVSIRRDDGDSGNEISLALANLGTHVADPVARLKTVQGSMNYAKTVLRSMTPAQIMAYTLAMLAPGALTLLPGLGHQRSVANVVISHVPGPRQAVYWQGCRLDGIYPASLLLDGFALNITLISRHDYIDFGIIACRKTLPGIQRLLEHLDEALLELENAAGISIHEPSRLLGAA